LLDKDADKQEKSRFQFLIGFTIMLVVLGSVSLMYLVRRIHWLLIVKDIELRHQSTKKSHEKVVNVIEPVKAASSIEHPLLLQPGVDAEPNMFRRSSSTYKKSNQMM